MRKEIMLGLLGTIGAGKTTVSDYLVRKGFARAIMGDLIREKAKQRGIELTRHNLQQLQKEYRKKYGTHYFIREAVKRVKNSKKGKMLIDGIRLPIDAKEAKKAGAMLILVDAPKKVRFERLRGRQRTGDSQTMQGFLKQERAEWRLFNFHTTLKYVDYKIDNSTNLKHLHKQVDSLIKKISRN